VRQGSCDLCARIERAEQGRNPHAVVRTSTGYVNLADVQYYPGYTTFVSKRCVNELHELGESERVEYLREMALVAEAVFDAFKPRKLNYELLGNGAPHLHWHLFPRPGDDPYPRSPVWEDTNFLDALHNDRKADAAEISKLKGPLLAALERTPITIEQRWT
jgi:diadenosine tetraphosphate (Ap4A) HIT family hydrolase